MESKSKLPNINTYNNHAYFSNNNTPNINIINNQLNDNVKQNNMKKENILMGTMNEGWERLYKEYNDLNDINKNSFDLMSNFGFTVGKVNNDIYKWRFSLIGPSDTPYADGCFILNLIFPKEYPKYAPEMTFLTPIYHPNVNCRNNKKIGGESLGHVSVNFLKNWKTETTVREMITKLYSIFYWPNSESGYSSIIMDEIKKNRPLYDLKAKYFTQKYANIKNKENVEFYDETWDFTCNENDLKSVKPTEEKKIIKSNDNYNINLGFSDNGREIKRIDCNINDLVSIAIQKYELANGRSIKPSSLLIYRCKKIVESATLKDNGITKGAVITIINDVWFS